MTLRGSTHPKTPSYRYNSEEGSLFAFLILDKENSVNHLYVVPKGEVLNRDGSMPTKKCISINRMDDPKHWSFKYRDNFIAIDEVTGNPAGHRLEQPSYVWVPNHLDSIPKRVEQ